MSVHLHTTIPKKTGAMLDQLANTYGTKSRVIEKAVETMLRVEKVGSCDDCVIKAQTEEQGKLRETMDLASIRKELLDEFLKIALGDQSISDFLHRQLAEAQNVVELLRNSIQWKVPTNFREFLADIEQLGEMTRLYDVASYREIDNTVILRPIVLTRIPEFVAFQVAIILDGIGIPFDLRTMRKDIILKMVRKDLAAVRKTDHKQKLIQQLEERFHRYKPLLFKENLALVGPAFLKWVAKNFEGSIADLSTVIEDIRTFIRPKELPDDPKELVDTLFTVGINMNWLTNVKTVHEPDDSLRISFQATSPPLAIITTVTFALILATKGWKLLRYNTEYDNGSVVIQYVGEGSHDVLDQLAEMNLYRVITEQFLDSIFVPRDIFESFASKVFDSDRNRFEDIFRNMGVRIANAIRMLSKEDKEKEDRLARNFIKKNLEQAEPNSEIRFVNSENFSIVFKQLEPLVLTSQRLVIESMLQTLGYEVMITPFQNLLNVKMRRTDKPILGPLPRREVVQMVSDAIAAESVEEALRQVKHTLDELYPLEYPWTIREIGARLLDMYRELGIQVGIEYFEGGFTLKYRTCPYYKLVMNNQKTWLCTFRKKAMEYILSRVTKSGKGRIKVIKSLIQPEKGAHPCEYAIFLEEFLGGETPSIRKSTK